MQQTVRNPISSPVFYQRHPAPRHGRRELLLPLLAPVGVAFLLVGGADIALTWYPLRIGAVDWELGTIMQTLNGLPVFALGLALLSARAAAGARRWPAVSVSIAMILVAIAIVAMAGLLALSVPVALNAVQDPAVLQGLKKAVLKAAVQVVAYPTMFVWLAVRTLRRAADSTEAA